MNGVHCQISEAMTASLGVFEIQSDCGAWLDPNSFQMALRVPSKGPYSGLSSACSHSSAAATGTTRNGAIRTVRTKPRPRNARSRRSARHNPSSSEISTMLAVYKIEVRIEDRSAGSVNAVLKLASPAKPRSLG